MPSGPAVLRFARGLPPSRQFGERLRLLVVQGPEKGTCFSILGDLVFIGREGCQIVLNDTNLSKKHAEMGWKGEHYVVRDLGSANGMVYNGQKVPEAHLKAGDVLVLGVSVMEVYPPGQTKRSDRPLLSTDARRATLPAPAAAQKAEDPSKVSLSPEAEKKKRDTDKKRLVMYAGLFFLVAMLYFSEGDNKTIRENARIEKGESEEESGKPKKKTVNLDALDKKLKNSEAIIKKREKSIKSAEKKIEEDRKAIKELETRKKELEINKEAIKEALSDYLPTYTADTQQRKDAEIFFRSGVRELQNKNYRRAFVAFETALTVDSTHDLAKIYLKTAKKEMASELDAMWNAALQSEKALRYKEARMHYGNVIRYLEGETGEGDYMENESNGTLKKMHEDAQKALVELDTKENKIK